MYGHWQCIGARLDEKETKPHYKRYCFVVNVRVLQMYLAFFNFAYCLF